MDAACPRAGLPAPRGESRVPRQGTVRVEMALGTEPIRMSPVEVDGRKGALASGADVEGGAGGPSPIRVDPAVVARSMRAGGRTSPSPTP
jgi:hypothetical protein